MATVGVPLLVDGTPVLVFADLTANLTDGDGHRMTYDWKGASGLKCCLRHTNCLKRGSDLASRDEGFVEVSCSGFSNFTTWEEGELADTVEMLLLASEQYESGDMTKDMFEDIENSNRLKCESVGSPC